MPRTVGVAPDQTRAEQLRKFYADQTAGEHGPMGEERLVYRVHKMPDGWRCTGYTAAELKKISEDKNDPPF